MSIFWLSFYPIWQEFSLTKILFHLFLVQFRIPSTYTCHQVFSAMVWWFVFPPLLSQPLWRFLPQKWQFQAFGWLKGFWGFFFYYFCGKMAFHRSSKNLETNLGKRGLPWWCRWQSICLQRRRPGFDPWVGKIPWRRKWQPTPVFLPGESHGRRSLIGYRPWGAKSQTRLHFHFLSLSREKIQPWGGWSTHRLELWHVCLWGSPDALGGLGEGETVEVLLPRGEEGKGILRERKTRDGA